MTMLLLLTLAGGSTVFAVENSIIDLATVDMTSGWETQNFWQKATLAEGCAYYSTGYPMIFTKTNGWISYKVKVAESGLYDISLGLSTGAGKATIGVSVDDDYERKIYMYNDGSYKVTFVTSVYLEQGERIIKFNCSDYQQAGQYGGFAFRRLFVVKNNEENITINSQSYKSATDGLVREGTYLSFQSGHSTQYELQLINGGTYQMAVEVSQLYEKKMKITVNEKDYTWTSTAIAGAAYGSMTTENVAEITLNPGVNTITVDNTGSAYHFCAINLTKTGELATPTTVTFTDSSSTEVSAVPAGTLNATVTFGSDVTDEVDCYLAVYKEKDGVKELIGYDKANAGDTPQMTVTGIATGETGCTYDAKVFLWKSDLTTAIKAYSIGAASE